MSENAKIKRERIKLKEGDVFEFDAPDGRLGYGVIVKGGVVPYVILLASLHERPPSLADLAEDEIALVGWTMDSLVYHGRWRIIAHDYPHRTDVPFPNWKVNIGDEIHVTDVTGFPIGKASSREVQTLDYQFSRALIAYQSAFEALHGFGEWQDHYDRLTPGYARQRMTRPAAPTST